MRFRLKKGKGSVSEFADSKGKVYLPGDEIELPASYQGEKWLECLEAKKRVVVPPASLVPEVPQTSEPSLEPPTEPTRTIRGLTKEKKRVKH